MKNRLHTVWQALATLSLSVWLLIVSSLIMLFNSEVASGRQQLYQRLNTTPLWIWLNETRHSDPLVFMAIVLLLVSLGVLALNTLACIISRLGDLSHLKGKRWGRSKVFVTWAPTLMHVLFFLLLASHMAAFSFGQWQYHTVRKGESLSFSPKFSPLLVTGFSRTIRLVRGPLQGSTVAHQVELRIEGKSAVVSELQPLKLPNGDWLLFLPPQQREKRGSVPIKIPVDCSGEERHVKSIPFDPSEPIRLKQVFDPAIYLLFTGFGLILILMGIHYTINWRNKGLR